VKLSTDERRALGLIAALLVLASGARWLERPKPLLADVPTIDVGALEQASRAAKPAAAGGTRGGRGPGSSGAPRPQTFRAAGDGAPERAMAASQRIDPNTATVEELVRLPGVGPALAERIIAERARAPFRSVEDLTRVHGIGAALAKRVGDHVSLPAVASVAGAARFSALTPVETAPATRLQNGVGEPLDINAISSTDLQKVTGVGPVLAARLIARRDSLGRFTSWGQVDAVAGVGPALLGRLQESTVIRP
jgi:competence protein ComEA